MNYLAVAALLTATAIVAPSLPSHAQNDPFRFVFRGKVGVLPNPGTSSEIPLPTSFSLGEVTGVLPDSGAVSEVHAVGPSPEPIPLAVTSPAGLSVGVSVNGGSFGPVPVVVPPGSLLRLRGMPSGLPEGQSYSVTMKVGADIGDWRVTLADAVPDTLPDLPSVTGSPGQRMESVTVSPGGFDIPLELTASSTAPDASPLVSKRSGGIWGSWETSVLVAPGEQFRVSATAPNAQGTSGTTTLKLGDYASATWAVSSGVATPDEFVVASAEGPGSQPVMSQEIDFSALSMSAPVVLPSGMTASVNGGPFELIDTLPANSRLRLMTNAPDGLDGETETHEVSVGGVSAYWTIAAHDVTPDPFLFDALAGEDASVVIESYQVDGISGFSHPATVNVSGEGNPEVSVNDGPWATAGTISPNDSLRIRLTSSTVSHEARSAQVTIGAYTTDFVVTTGGVDPDPEAASMVMADTRNLDPDGIIISTVVEPSGFDTATILSVSGEGNPEVSVSERPWATEARLRPGETYRVRVRTAVTYLEERLVTITAGATEATWTVQTRSNNEVPDPIDFGMLVGQAPNSIIVSQARTPVGYLDSATLVAAGGEISIDGGPWLTEAHIVPGQSIRVRTTTGMPDGVVSSVILTAAGTEVSKWDVETIDTMMDMPWSLSQLNAIGMELGAEEWRLLPEVVTTGFSSPARFTYTCTSTAGTGPWFGIVTNGAWRDQGDFVLPGDRLELAVEFWHAQLGETALCTINLGGLLFDVPLSRAADSSEPTNLRQLESQAGLTAGNYAVTERYYPYGNNTASFVQIEGDGQIEIGGDGVWRAAGSQYSVEAGSWFRIRALAGLPKTIVIEQGANRDLRQIVRFTAGAPDSDIAGRMPAVNADHVGETINGHEPFAALSYPNGPNVCVDVTATGDYEISLRSALGDHVILTANGRTWDTEGRLCPGQYVTLAVRTPSEVGEVSSGTISIGNWSQVYTYTLEGPNLDGDPNPFNFPNVFSAAPGGQIVSNSIVPAGYNSPVRVHVSGDGNPMLSVDGGEWVSESARILPGQSLRVSLTAGASDGTTRNATVLMGAHMTTWSVSTDNNAVDPFSFNPTIDVEPGSALQSNEVLVSGVGAGQIAVAINGEGSPTFSINGGVQRTSALVGEGDRIRLSADAPGTYASTRTITLTVGTTAGEWFISTRAEDD